MPRNTVYFAAIVLGAAISVGCARKAPEEAPKAADPLGDLAAPASPTFELPKAPTATTLRVLVGGDVLPHRPRLLEPAKIHAALEPLSPFFQSSDAVVVNFEAATGDPDHATKMAYVAPPEWLSALKESGVTAITAANNHSCDMGPMGVRTTLSSADAAGLTTVGIGAGAPFTHHVIAEKDGKKVCAVAWTNLMNSHSCEGSTLVAFAPATRRGTAEIVSAVRKARESCDAVIAIFHGGDEYAPQTEATMAQARRAADAGADAVIMHHPHIVSPEAKHTTKDGRTVPIFASLGNLVTNQGESWKPPMYPVLRTDRHLVCVNGWTRLGMLADLTFSFSGTHKALSYASHLVYIENEHANDKKAKMPKIDVRMLSPEGDKDVIARLKDDPEGPVPVFDDPCWFEASGKRCDADVDSKTKPQAGEPVAFASDEEQGPSGSPRSRRLTAAHVSTKTDGSTKRHQAGTGLSPGLSTPSAASKHGHKKP